MDLGSTSFTIMSFNCKSIKRSAQHVRDLCSDADIIALQETWLMPHELDFVHDIDCDFDCIAKSSVDAANGVLRGRPYGGVALMWRKSKFQNVSVIDSNNDRIIVIQITVGLRSFLVICVYMPVEKIENLTDFINCLGNVSAIVEESQVQVAYIVGDFNAHPSSSFGTELLLFCKEQKWDCVDITKLGISSSTHTYLSEVHGCCRSEVPILIFLVDHFKEINDFGGPPAPTFSPCSQNDGNWCHE